MLGTWGLYVLPTRRTRLEKGHSRGGHAPSCCAVFLMRYDLCATSMLFGRVFLVCVTTRNQFFDTHLKVVLQCHQ